MASEWVSGTVDEKTGLVRTEIQGCWVTPDHKILDLPKDEQRVVLKQFAKMTGAKFISEFLLDKSELVSK